MPATPRPILFIFLLWVLFACARSGQTLALDLTDLAPVAGDLDDWAPIGPVQNYEGIDLYKLINGGAEVYREYGFLRVLAQDYRDQKNRYIALEIYEMENPTAAFGIYSFKTGTGGQSVAVGNEAILAGYYLNIWKGRFLLTLSGANADKATHAGLMEIGKTVAGNISEPGSRPEMTQMLPVEPSAPDKIRYMVGDLALTNLAPFSGLAPFGFTEGLAADYGESSLFLLAFDSSVESANSFTSMLDRIESKGLAMADSTMPATTQGIRFKDGKGETLHLELLQRYILVTVGEEDAECGMIRKSLRARLATKVDD